MRDEQCYICRYTADDKSARQLFDALGCGTVGESPDAKLAYAHFRVRRRCLLAYNISARYESVFLDSSARRLFFCNAVYRVSDTAGLAAFTVTGVITAIHSYPGYRYVLPVLLGLITAVGGGILRDVLAQKVPVVLYEDVYAMASVLGGIVICVLYPLTGIVYASWGGFGAVLLLRICAILFGWRLYHPARTHGSGSGSRE